MIEQVKGTRNLFGAESEKYIHIFNAFCDAFVDYGFEFLSPTGNKTPLPSFKSA